MNAVGIDVSSRKSTVAVLRPLGEVVCLPFDVSHDADGLASLAEKLKAFAFEYSDWGRAESSNGRAENVRDGKMKEMREA